MNNSNNLTRHENNIVLVAEGLKLFGGILDKIEGIVITAKELENKGYEIQNIRHEIIEFYKTERTRLIEVFKENKAIREDLKKMISDSIAANDDVMRDVFIDIYKDYIAGSIAQTSINEFSAGNKKNRISKIIEI